MNFRASIYAVAIITAFSGLACAELVIGYVDISPEAVWLHEDDKTVSIYATCEYDGDSSSLNTVTASIFPLGSGIPSTSEMNYDSNKERYSLTDLTFPFSEPGIYDVNITCTRDDESTSQLVHIQAQLLNLDIVKDSDVVNAYMGDYLTVKLVFSVDNGDGSKIIPPPQGTYSVEIGSRFKKNDIDQKDIRVVGGQYQSVTVGIPQDASDGNYLSEGLYDLEITAEYSLLGETTSITKNERSYVRINPALKLGLPESTIQCVMGSVCKKEVDASVIFPIGDIDEFTVDNFEAVAVNRNAEGKKVFVNQVVCDQKTHICKITLDIPSTMASDLYDLYLSAAYPSISNYEYMSKSSIPLSVVLRLTGEMKDASGSIIETKFAMENKETGETFTATADGSGKYNLDVLPATYDIEVQFFGGVVAKFGGVTIGPDIGALNSNFIRFDKDYINSRGPGTRPVKIVVVEFALPFESMWMYVPYDSSKVNGDEDLLSVHNCYKWNFKKRTCSGEWTEIGKEIHSIQDSLEFATNVSGAFIIGEKRLLSITDVEVKTEKVYINEPVSIIGKVVDADGSPIEDMEVIASFPKFNISRTTLSKTGGLFGLEINAPYAEGPVEMVVGMGEPIYASGNVTKSIDVLRKKELSIVGLSDMIDVEVGKEKTIKFQLYNSGQTNLTKTLHVTAKGISTDWYTMLPLNINGINAGDRKEVELKVKMTKDLCGGSCPQFSLVTIEASSDEIVKSTSFTLRVQSQENTNATSNAASNANTQGDIYAGGGDLFGVPDITGFAVSMPKVDFDGNYLFLTFIVVLLFLIVGKKKKKKKPGPRASVVASLHKIKTGI